MAITCFRYLGFRSFDQVDQLTIAQYEIMTEALELKLLDHDFYQHRQAFLNYAVQAQKSAGKGKSKPVYRRFRQFFDFDRELSRLKERRGQKKKERYSGIGKLLNKSKGE